MRYYYAIIDEKNICHGSADVPSKIITDNYIEIPSLPAPIGKKYENSEWVEVPPEELPETPEEPTGETATWDAMAQAISEGVNEV